MWFPKKIFVGYKDVIKLHKRFWLIPWRVSSDLQSNKMRNIITSFTGTNWSKKRFSWRKHKIQLHTFQNCMTMDKQAQPTVS